MQHVPGTATVAVRTAGAPSDLAPAVREAIRQVDPDVPIYDVRPMTVHLDDGSAFFVFRLGAFMTSLFGGMGMLLASIGLYGMIAYHVAQRTPEIGVRMALGARAADIIRDVLARGGRYALIGIGVGVVLSAGVARLLKGLLLGVSPFDPITYASVAALLITICVLASIVPARRATTVEPLICTSCGLEVTDPSCLEGLPDTEIEPPARLTRPRIEDDTVVAPQQHPRRPNA